MKTETAKKRITNAVKREFPNETQAVKDYIANVVFLSFQNFELNTSDYRADGKPYTSTDNLNFAIDSNLHDVDTSLLVEEARRETSK